MVKILSSKNIQDGETSTDSGLPGHFYQPLQFLSREEKDEKWWSQNADFLEYEGLRQIFMEAPRLVKNLYLSRGIIDKSDYMPSTNPENRDLLNSLLDQVEETHLDLRFFPIIPNVINTIVTEFARRNTKSQYVGVDEFSENEMLELKQAEIERVLLAEAEQKFFLKLVEAGHDPDKEGEFFQQQLSEENIKSLPEIQSFFTKDYRSMVEEWAGHVHTEDTYRFRLDEMEEKQFEMGLTTDREWWHFKMMENDYEIESWSPLFTFYFKSPSTQYASDYYAIGQVRLLSIPEILDAHGSKMTEDQQKALHKIYPATNSFYSVTGYQQEAHYDTSKSQEWNKQGPSIGARQNYSMYGNLNDQVSMLEQLMHPYSSGYNMRNYLLRETTMYWKTHRRVGYMTKISESGEISVDIVDEDYEVTDNPIYNTTLVDNRTPTTLVFGEHIDWMWINQTCGMVKLGPNAPSYYGMVSTQGSLQPIYLGIESNKPGPLRYQFKGSETMYGCKLPVEGCVFTDYHTRSVAIPDLLKPYQISHNVVMNQINDILVSELGMLIAIDPNQIPQKSLGEDWGKGNLNKLYAVMKNFNLITLDRSLENTQAVGSTQAPLQVLDASETNRLLTKINLAGFFKNEGLSLLGITPQRLGQPTGRKTANEVEELAVGAYAQTEKYFIRHSDYLMPRFHQMRTDLAMYYASNRKVNRFNYITSREDRINFTINGDSLLLRDLNIHMASTASSRNVVAELRKMLVTNNTAGGTIFELGDLMTADSLGEMINILRGIEKKAEAKQQAEYQHQQELERQIQERELMEKKMELDYEARENEANRRKDILVAQIRAAGYSGSVDLNQNSQNDFLDNLQFIQGQQEFQQTMNVKRESEQNKLALSREKMNIDREKMQTQREVANTNLRIARENQSSAELEAKRKRDRQEREKKRKKK